MVKSRALDKACTEKYMVVNISQLLRSVKTIIVEQILRSKINSLLVYTGQKLRSNFRVEAVFFFGIATPRF